MNSQILRNFCTSILRDIIFYSLRIERDSLCSNIFVPHSKCVVGVVKYQLLYLDIIIYVEKKIM